MSVNISISSSLKRIASEKGLSPSDIAKKADLNEDIVLATLEGYPLIPIAHFCKIAEAIGCKLEIKGKNGGDGPL